MTKEEMQKIINVMGGTVEEKVIFIATESLKVWKRYVAACADSDEERDAFDLYVDLCELLSDYVKENV